ncbi:hypothetical protein Pse7367_3538 [Thalassoporum mexicanum PCC 7367]|uniref:hypothetical protein n=1 Tax=Thalassoporum mexicanum TaxID=3457544 RepID=UPI00029FD053|nr:hypothetical protein [Pseudanabaena sp. PCC 7367]AFY71773.1 hypothetical protein Pse7367_3538 [Pseudanabaena sp. PCC 7367]
MSDQNQDLVKTSQDIATPESDENGNGHEINLDKGKNEVWQAYLKSKKKYREVYRYLAEN